MTITEKEIKALAKLAKLYFDDERCKSFAPEFAGIIEFAGHINDAVEGTAETLKEVGGREINWEDLREDEVEESLASEKILSNVEGQDGYFPVKRVVK